MKKRIDRILFEKELASSRTQASDLISDGHVSVDGVKILKPSLKFSLDIHIEIKKEQIFVGRGAHKIEGACAEFNLSFKNKIVGDMGASTGGFTEFVLHLGAQKVYAVDVGVGQLAEKLVVDERVVNCEGLNIKEGLPFDDCDILVADLSFISLKKVIGPMNSGLKVNGEFLFLVKPQFEVGKKGLGKKGVVKDCELITNSVLEVVDFCHHEGLNVTSCCACPIKGKTGNQEFFIYGLKDPQVNRVLKSQIEEIIKVSL